MDPFTLALLGSTAASALSSGAGYAASQRAAGTQAQAAQQSGMLGYIAQQQALEEARRRTQQGVDASREFYGKGREDLLAQGRTGAETAREFYGKGVAAQEPYTTAGAGATNQLAQLYGVGGDYTRMPTLEELQMDPGYAFRTKMGEQAMLNMARAGGTAGSGGALKASIRYGQEAGSQEYQNAYARFMENRLRATQGLEGLAGRGASAAGTVSQLAGTMGGQLSGNQFNLGSNLGTMATNAGNTVAGAYTGAIPTMAGLTSANPYGQAMENVGQARASGYVGGASALGQALQGPANAMLAYNMMDRFSPQGPSGSYQFGGQNVPYFNR